MTHMLSAGAYKGTGFSFARALGPAYAWAGLGIMWMVWVLLFVFLSEPRAVKAWVNLPAVDGPAGMPLFVRAAIDCALIALFGLQHSVMARPFFKRWLARLPAPFVRVTFVHAANLALLALVFAWQPIPIPIWQVTSKLPETLLWALFGVGWLVLLLGAISFGIRDLLGIREMQAWAQGKRQAQRQLKTGLLYRWLHHPMYVGVLLAFWATPRMTLGHLLFAGGMSIYVLIALGYEERDLKTSYGRAYEDWVAGAANVTDASTGIGYPLTR